MSTQPEVSNHPPVRRSRWKRWRIWFFMVAIVAGLWGWWYWDQREGEAELAAAEARWDAEGAWRWKDWVASRPAPAEAENGAFLIDRMVKLMPGNLETELSYLLLDGTQERHPNHVLHEEQAKEYRRRIAASRETLKLFPELSKKKAIVYPIDVNASPMTMPTQIDQYRALLNLLIEQWELQFHEKQLREAVISLEHGLQLCRAMDYHSSFLGRLVQISLTGRVSVGIQRWLALCEPAEADLMRVEQLLERLDRQSSWKQMILVECGMRDQTIREFQAGKYDLSRLWGGGGGGSWWETQWERVTTYFHGRRMLQARQHAECLRLMHACYLQADQPWTEQRKYYKALVEGIKKERGLGQMKLVHLLFPAMEKVLEAELQSLAYLRATVVGLAAERFRLEQKRWPATQEEMVGKFLKSVQLDPFDGQPLRMKRLVDGLVVYSIGRDDTDDGGFVISTEEKQRTDFGIRLWDVTKRRQPTLGLPLRYVERLEQMKKEKE